MKIFSVLAFVIVCCNLYAQPISKSFELRYFTPDTLANGETDFKGETSVFTTDERIDFLSYYADEVSDYYDDQNLNTEIAPEKDVKKLMASIKPLPLPEVRTRIKLDEWRVLSSCPGQHEASLWELSKYKGAENMVVKDGAMCFIGDAKWKWDIDVQTWRFSLGCKIRLMEKSCKAGFMLLDNATNKAFVKIEIRENNLFYDSNREKEEGVPLGQNVWHEIKIEGSLDNFNETQRYNLYIDGILIADFVPSTEDVNWVNSIEISSSSGLEIDELWGIGYQRTTQERYPFYPATFIDENFEQKPSLDGWQTAFYDDRQWRKTNLPFGQGSERYKGEDLYFRNKVKIHNFKRAYLNVEAIDPGGEIWVNGKLAGLVKDRYPIKLDITKYLNPYSENQLAVKVNHFYLSPSEGQPNPHSALDNNATWFAGRVWLDLTDETFVDDVFFYTKNLKDGVAVIQTDVSVQHKGALGFKGMIKVKMGVWDENFDNNLMEVAEKPLLIGPGKKNINILFSVKNPKLWEPNSPNLYKVVIEILNKDGITIDVHVFITGIRTVSQEGGTFRLNGKPFMLNGTQIMGFRSPIEKMMIWFRCPPEEWVAKEMLMTQNMNCNMLRIHVHGWKGKAVGVNDPRYAEYADQMGIMIISCPPAWIREGDWGQVDFEGYHKYMKQTQNHPSIVMWEIANHPNTFNINEAYESDLFSETAYNAVYPYDPSRLISITSHIAHLSYGNDYGTLDKGGRSLLEAIGQVQTLDPGNQMALNAEIGETNLEGNRIVATRAWTAPMVTRGNQDVATGYGAEWSQLRKWPGAYRQSFLDSNERAYFNFEHQESIGQPNWNLCKGKPWYLLQSYEWDYDKGSIGRRLTTNEWRESQAWQAFSAYEAIKKMRMLDYDGFSWCSLHGGSNMGTYKKPAIDFLGHGKLVYHIHKTVFQSILAGSNNVDVVYGPDDKITPMILNIGDERTVMLTVIVRDKFEGKVIDKKVYKNVKLNAGRTITELACFLPNLKQKGMYFIEYLVNENK